MADMRGPDEKARTLFGELGHEDQKIPVWLDCDTGHDDAFAILVAATSPRINLLGISTVYGNAPIERTTENTLAILTAIDRPGVHVYSGSAQPFCRPPCFAPDIHGESGLDGTTRLPKPRVTPVESSSAIQTAYEALIRTPVDTAYVIATGCLTNIALLFATYPLLAIHIAGLHIMGGAIGSDFTNAPMGTVSADGEAHGEQRFGNWTPFAEFNVYLDPEAASSVFGNPMLKDKVTLVPLDLSHLFLATKDVQRNLLYGFDTKGTGPHSDLRSLFHEILTFFAKTYADVFGLTDGPPLHDVLPALAVLAPQIFDDRGGERFEVKVVTDGAHGTQGIARTKSQCGRTRVMKLPAGSRGIRIPRDVDQDVAWRIIDLCLATAEKEVTGMRPLLAPGPLSSGI